MFNCNYKLWNSLWFSLTKLDLVSWGILANSSLDNHSFLSKLFPKCFQAQTLTGLISGLWVGSCWKLKQLKFKEQTSKTYVHVSDVQTWVWRWCARLKTSKVTMMKIPHNSFHETSSPEEDSLVTIIFADIQRSLDFQSSENCVLSTTSRFVFNRVCLCNIQLF